MKKRAAHIAFACLISSLLGAGLPQVFASSSDAARLIVPGRSIGKLRLGPDGAAALRRLPKPTAHEEGMMQSRLVWRSPHAPHDTLFVHTVRNGALDVQPSGGVTIDRVRVTSPWFHTRGGLSVGSTLAQVRHRFPDLRREPRGETQGRTLLYDITRKGIAFEFRRDSPAARCLSITVYPPSQGPASGGGITQAQVEAILKTG